MANPAMAATAIPGAAMHQGGTKRSGDGLRLAGLALVALCLLCASCGSAAKGTLFRGPVVVNVIMVDNLFRYNPSIPAGRILFKVSNAGQASHRLTLVPLAADIPPINEQLHGAVRASITPFAGTPTMPPGSEDSFAVDLLPGQRYALLDFLKDPGATDSHALLGMNSEFRTPNAAKGRA